jgi:hypothetical protein
VTLALGIVNV